MVNDLEFKVNAFIAFLKMASKEEWAIVISLIEEALYELAQPEEKK